MSAFSKDMITRRRSRTGQLESQNASMFKWSKPKDWVFRIHYLRQKILDCIKRSQLTVKGRPRQLMPLSIRLQKKRSSNCLDLFSRAVTGLTDKNNCAEVDGCVH